jgi:hypothetical protein
LHHAVAAGVIDSVKVLAEWPGVDLNVEDSDGVFFLFHNTPLKWAFNWGKIAIGRYLQQKGAVIKVRLHQEEEELPPPPDDTLPPPPPPNAA